MNLRFLWETWRAGYLPPRALAALQMQRLNELVAYARRHAPYYAQKYSRLPAQITDIGQLPPLTKLEILTHYDEMVTDPEVSRAGVEAFVSDPSRIGQFYLGRYAPWITSGTTGERLVSLGDAPWLERMGMQNLTRMTWQMMSPAWLLRRMLKGPGRSAYILATGSHYSGVWLATNLMASPAGKAGRILILPVTLQSAEMVRELNAFQPTTLTGYASALGLLAEAQQAGRLNIAPRMVVNTAEALRIEDRRTIQSVFGCQVRDIYSSAEVGVITYECRYGARHINADSIIVETVDEQYQPLPPGQAAGNVLVTSLTKRVMPIIRYELRDQVTILPGQCRCGLHLPMITFQGRTDHTLTFQTCEGKSIKVLPLALYAAIKKSPYAMTAQVVQTGPACLKIRLTPGPGQDSETTWNQVVDSVRQFLDSQDLQCVELIRAVEPPQRDPRSNKLHEAIVDFK